MTRFSSLNRVGLLAALLLVGFSSALHAQTITTFDPPDSTFTRPSAINFAGQVTGYYSSGSPSALPQSFLRQPDGTIITFAVPNPFFPSAFAMDIDRFGQITGWFIENNPGPLVTAAFLRQRDGTIITFSGLSSDAAPSAALEPAPLMTCSGDGSIAVAINAAAQITGSTGNGTCNGFLRQPNGDTINFRLRPDLAFSETQPQAINRRGQITGWYSDDVSTRRGFLRQPNGTIVLIDVPNATRTVPRAINILGQITGYYQDASFASHGFLRQRNRTILTFDPTGSINTQATAINTKGQITGFYATADGIYHGFLRRRNGNLETFDVSGAGNGGTFPQDINDFGQIVGYYLDASFVVHGFVRSAR